MYVRMLCVCVCVWEILDDKTLRMRCGALLLCYARRNAGRTEGSLLGFRYRARPKSCRIFRCR